MGKKLIISGNKDDYLLGATFKSLSKKKQDSRKAIEQKVLEECPKLLHTKPKKTISGLKFCDEMMRTLEGVHKSRAVRLSFIWHRLSVEHSVKMLFLLIWVYILINF